MTIPLIKDSRYLRLEQKASVENSEKMEVKGVLSRG